VVVFIEPFSNAARFAATLWSWREAWGRASSIVQAIVSAATCVVASANPVSIVKTKSKPTFLYVMPRLAGD
jgi:hypothetical protein